MKLGIILYIYLSFLSVNLCQAHNPWGFFAHRQINYHAVFFLPEQIHPFFRKHIEFISEHAVDPDKRRHAVKEEAARHYIDLDHYGSDLDSLKKNFPRSWDAAVSQYSEDTLKAYGIAPWNAYRFYFNMVEAFKGKDLDKLLQALADFGHYVGDMHVPLHTTENYNGQLTGQDGIHGFWESRLPELYFDSYDLSVESAKYVERPLALFWDIIFESHRNMPIVLGEEKKLAQKFGGSQFTYEERGQSTTKTYSESYSQAYHENLNGMVEERLRASVFHLACLWYSAWVDAGQPDLEKFDN
ncbi:MAG: zinc dependent phospholipase C family protein [Luteibaculum sp.]